MAQIEQYNQTIQSQLQKLSSLIHRSPLFGSNRKHWIQQCKRVQKNIYDEINTCEQQIRGLEGMSRKHYIQKIKDFKTTLRKLRQQYDQKLRQQTNTHKRMDEQEEDPNSTMRVIQRGDEAQDRTHQAIDSMMRTAQEGISLADEINVNLNKQIQQLDRIHGKVKDTESSLKRAQKTINYFMKALECDKCMMGLLLLNVLALIALIVMAIKKK